MAASRRCSAVCCCSLTVRLPARPSRNAGKTPPPHLVEKNGGQVVNLRLKYISTLQSKVNFPGPTDGRLASDSAQGRVRTTVG